MKTAKTIAVAAVLALMLALTACGETSSLALDQLDEVSGVKATAENADTDNVVTSSGAILVNEGDTIIISPCLDNGSFHLTIASADGKTVVYDDDAEGRVLFSVDAAPGTYDVEISGNGGTTGWMTVFAESAADLTAENESLAEALEANGVDPSIISKD